MSSTGAGRKDHVAGLEDFGLAITLGRKFHLAVGQQLAVPDQPFHLVRLEQAGDAAGELAHDAGFALLHGREVDFDTGNLDAVLRELVLRAMHELGGFEQCLRRNAAGVQAGAAEGVLALPVPPFVYARDVHAVLGGADRGDVTAGARADHYHVVAFRHVLALSFAGCLECTCSNAERPGWRECR